MARIAKKARKAGKTVERADKKVARSAAAAKHHPVAQVLHGVAKAGDQPPLLALSLGVLAMGWWRQDRRVMRAGGRMLAAELVGIVIKDLAKRAVTRTRPHVLIDEGRYELRTGGPHEGKFNSFPSGHTVGAVAVSRALVREFPDAKGPAYGFAAAVAAGRLPGSAHFPTDVAAGAVVGLVSEAIVDRVFRAIDAQLERAPHGTALGAGREVPALIVETPEQVEAGLRIV